jgi:hypothetical protein
MQVAHGRRPFRGARKVLASLLENYSPGNSTDPSKES